MEKKKITEQDDFSYYKKDLKKRVAFLKNLLLRLKH